MASNRTLQPLDPNVPSSLRPPKKYRRKIEVVPIAPPVVSLQTVLLCHDDLEGIPPSIDTWTSAQLVREFVEPTSEERRAIIRFDNGVESDVCWGALHFALNGQQRRARNLEITKHLRNSQGASTSPADGICSTSSFGGEDSSADPSSDKDENLYAMDASTSDANSDYSSNDDLNLCSKCCPTSYDTFRSKEIALKLLALEENSQAQATHSFHGRQASTSAMAGGHGVSGMQSSKEIQSFRKESGARDDCLQHTQTVGAATDVFIHPMLGKYSSIIEMKKRARRGIPLPHPKQTRMHKCSTESNERRQLFVLASGLARSPQKRTGSNSKRCSKKDKVDEDPMLAEYASEKWVPNVRNYLNPSLPFCGPEPGCTNTYDKVPTCLHVFEKYWTPRTLTKIVRESNRYASVVRDKRTGQTNGGLDWTPLEYHEFRAYLGVLMFMGLKPLPHMRCYWSENEALLHCPVISKLFTRERFESISRCLHVANGKLKGTDKIGKLRWLHDVIRLRCEKLWNPNQQLAVDESMVRYKGQYCPIRQYMPAKPVRFGIKVWALADDVVKYMWTFQVYCGKDPEHTSSVAQVFAESGLHFMAKSGKGTGMQGAAVVLDLTKSLHGRGHIVTTDSYFTSVPLFLHLLDQGTMATGTLKSNQKYVPREMWDKKVTKKELGWKDSRMHISRRICSVVWKDRVPVLLLSTHAEAHPPEGEKQIVKRKGKGGKKLVPTGPMHLQYQRKMRGVDSVDQMRGYYSTLTNSHKWWHRIFHFLLDTSVVNSWILHSDLSFKFMTDPMTHLAFQMQLAKELTSKWPGRMQGFSKFATNVCATYGIRSMGQKRRLCKICNKKTSHVCPGCNGFYICEQPCYWSCHWS